MKTLQTLTVAVSLAFAGVAMAQDDSSADAAAGYPATVAASEGVVIRVPVAADGTEVSDLAEMRVTGAADSATSAVVSAFETGVPVAKEAILDENSDSSTSHYGSCGWNDYYSYGSRYSSYGRSYQSYRPSYSYYQSSWSYSYSYSYSQSYSSGWGSSGYSSYNYYYYSRSSRSYGGSHAGWGHGW